MNAKEVIGHIRRYVVIIALSAIIINGAVMRIFKTRLFAKWARKEKLSDLLLRQAVQEMEAGLVDGDLGGHVYKKRIALKGRGKRGGVRSIIAYKASEKAFFIFGYAKNEKDNITIEEKKIAKALAGELLAYSIEQLNKLVRKGVFFEVNDDE